MQKVKHIVFAVSLITLTILGWILFRGPGLRQRLSSALVGLRWNRRELEIGTEQALQEVQKEYNAELARLNHDQQEEADVLAHDPVALACYLSNIRKGVRVHT